MFEDDDFFLGDDDLQQENQLTILDDAKMKLLVSIKNSTEKAIDCLKYNERNEAKIHSDLAGNYIQLLMQLNDADENLSEAEQKELVEQVLKETTELTLNNIDDILKDEDEENDDLSSSKLEDTADDDGLDF